MDFNIRAISLAESVNFDARIALSEFLGREIEFRSGISMSITLPHNPEAFDRLPDAERLLSALPAWSRVYSYPDGDSKSMHVLATTNGLDEDAEILFYRLDLRQPSRIKPGPRPAVEIVGGAIMTFEECGKWLVELSYGLLTNSDQFKGSVRLMRPRPLKPKPIRVGWVGPETLNGFQMALRLNAIGQVFGAEVVHVAPRSFVHVANRLAKVLPLDAVVICSGFTSYISSDAVPASVRRDLIHLCDSTWLRDLEEQIVTWVSVARTEIEKDQKNQSTDENQELLKIMLRGMWSHSKIGQFSHCQKTTVLTGVRARHLNVSTAERILEENSDVFQDTKACTSLLLYKDHHDGRQYFLNPQQVETIKKLLAIATSTYSG
jgi:hypothetical protein